MILDDFYSINEFRTLSRSWFILPLRLDFGCLMTLWDRSVVWPVLTVYSKKLCVRSVDDELLTEIGYISTILMIQMESTAHQGNEATARHLSSLNGKYICIV